MKHTVIIYHQLVHRCIPRGQGPLGKQGMREIGNMVGRDRGSGQSGLFAFKIQQYFISEDLVFVKDQK